MIKLEQAHQEFINHLKKRGRASATVLAYGKDIEQLVEFLKQLEKLHIKDVAKEDLEAFMAKLKKENYTNKSISRKTNSTKTFFKFLKVQEYVTDDPANLITHPKVDPRAPRILTQMEYRALRDAARQDKRTNAIVELLLQTGMRISELHALKIENITFNKGKEKGELIVRPIENREERVIPLNIAAEKAIKDYIEIRPKCKETTLFVTKTGRPLLIRNIRSTINRFFQLAGIQNATVNDLRHTFVAHHLQKGASLVLVSKVAGHKRISTTEKYLEYITRPKEEVQELEEL